MGLVMTCLFDYKFSPQSGEKKLIFQVKHRKKEEDEKLFKFLDFVILLLTGDKIV